MSTPDILSSIAKTAPEKTALVADPPDGEAMRIDFATFNAQVNQLCRMLSGLDVSHGDKIVWCGPNSVGVVRMMHAARKLGATAVPLNYRFSPEEAVYVVDHCDAELVYVDAEYADLIAGIRSDVPKVREVVVFGGDAVPGTLDGDARMASESVEEPEAGRAHEQASTMIYTSGTTGKPKGALRRGLGDRDQVRQMMALIGYVPEDVFLTTGPLYHSGPGGFMMISHMLSNTVVLQRKFDAEDWLRLVETHRVTTTFSAPTPVRMVCNLPEETVSRHDTSSMQRMVANAAPWSQALKLAYLERFPEDSLFEVYGSTELGVNAILEPKDQRRKPGSCGKPAPTVEIQLFDDDGNPVTEPDVPGELFVRSKTVFDTYYKAHDRYEEDRRGGFHTVGDVAYFDDEGYFYICDRKKDMIISGGMNIYPAEIEAALDNHEKIADVAVFGIPSEDWGESVHAVVVVRQDESLGEADVVSYAREHLAAYKIPRSVSFAEEIPRNDSGKILKRVLREPWWSGHESQVQ